MRSASDLRVTVRLVWPQVKTPPGRDFSVFEATLVDADGDHCGLVQYFYGETPVRNKAAEALKVRFLNGSLWNMTSVKQLQAVQPRYAAFSCPYRIVLQKNGKSQVSLQPVMHAPDLLRRMPRRPAARGDLGDLPMLQGNRLVNVQLLLKEMSPARTTTSTKDVVADAWLVDAAGRVAHVTVWRDHVQELKNSLGKVLNLYNILAQPGPDQAPKFDTIDATHIEPLEPDDCDDDRSRLLQSKAEELMKADMANLAHVTAEYEQLEGRDYAMGEVPETTAAALAMAAQCPANTDVEVFQVNGAVLALMPANDEADVRTKKGDRLWVPGRLQDCTGSCDVRVSERALLQLCAVAQDEAHQAVDGIAKDIVTGVLLLPRCNARVRRSVRDAKGRADEQLLKLTSIVVVAAAPIFVTSVPTCLPVTAEDRVIPCTLTQLGVSSFGSMYVDVGTAKVFITGAIVCLRGSARAATVEKREHDAAVVKNPNVVDVLAPTELQKTTVTALGIASLAALAQLQLQKTTWHLALITAGRTAASGGLEEVVISNLWSPVHAGVGATDADVLNALQAFDTERLQVQAAVAKRHCEKKRLLPSSADELAELLTPPSKRVCRDLTESPLQPVSPTVSTPST